MAKKVSQQICAKFPVLNKSRFKFSPSLSLNFFQFFHFLLLYSYIDNNILNLSILTTIMSSAPATNYKVADISLAAFGRKDIELSENEMPGLMYIRKSTVHLNH